jgi:hypothetical protein
MFDSPLGPRAKELTVAKGLTVAKVHNELQSCSAQWGAHANSQNIIQWMLLLIALRTLELLLLA